MNTGFIYGLICPIDNKIKYIGQSFYSIKRRLKRHIAQTLSKKGKLTKKEAWIKSLIDKNMAEQISFVILEECEKAKLNENEVQWIKKYGIENLTNLAEGGAGNVLIGANHPNYGKTLSEETKRKIGEANSGEKSWMYGRKNIHSEITRKRISEGLKNSEKFRSSKADPLYREKVSDSQSKNSAVLLINKNTNQVVGEWKNCHKLAEYLGCTNANVRNARKDHRPIGKKIKKLDNQLHYVIYKKDYTTDVSISLDQTSVASTRHIDVGNV